MPGDAVYLSLPYCSALAPDFCIPISQLKNWKNSKWRERGEQLRMIGLPGYFLKIFTSSSLEIPNWFWSSLLNVNVMAWLQTYDMFCIATEVICNIKTCFSAFNWVVMAALWVVWLVCDWFVDGLGGLWLIWVVWLACGWFVENLWVVWMVWG